MAFWNALWQTTSAGDNPLRRYLHTEDNEVSRPYALVTGATGGMGEEWAYVLASLGFHLVIQGRNRNKLEKVRQNIVKRQDDHDELLVTKQTGGQDGSEKFQEACTNVVVELLVCEATCWPNQGLQQGLHDLFGPMQRRKLSVVINNLGVQSLGYPRLEDMTSEEISGIVVANSLFPAEVTRFCLPLLKLNAPSLLITVTSIGAWTPTPYLSPYMGTKGFDVAFSRSLRNEMACENANVDVVCMVPGQVQSGMCLEPESLMVPTSSDWVQAAVNSLRPGGWVGSFVPRFLLSSLPSSSWLLRPKAVITPWWPHYVGMLVAQYGPSWLLDSIATQTVVDLKRKHI